MRCMTLPPPRAGLQPWRFWPRPFSWRSAGLRGGAGRCRSPPACGPAWRCAPEEVGDTHTHTGVSASTCCVPRRATPPGGYLNVTELCQVVLHQPQRLVGQLRLVVVPQEVIALRGQKGDRDEWGHSPWSVPPPAGWTCRAGSPGSWLCAPRPAGAVPGGGSHLLWLSAPRGRPSRGCKSPAGFRSLSGSFRASLRWGCKNSGRGKAAGLGAPPDSTELRFLGSGGAGGGLAPYLSPR